MSQAKKRVKWTLEEDERLEYSVRVHGSSNWVLVASELADWNRTGKQCRERWLNHLAPEVQHGVWSADEDLRLLQAVAEHGSQWTRISLQFPGRSPNALKNRWRTLTDPRQRIKIKGITNIVELLSKCSHLSVTAGKGPQISFVTEKKQRQPRPSERISYISVLSEDKRMELPSIDMFPMPEEMARWVENE